MIKRILAFFHIAYVCEMSQGKRDYHDYMDDVDGEPWHFLPMQCKHCGKTFYL